MLSDVTRQRVLEKLADKDYTGRGMLAGGLAGGLAGEAKLRSLLRGDKSVSAAERIALIRHPRLRAVLAAALGASAGGTLGGLYGAGKRLGKKEALSRIGAGA